MRDKIREMLRLQDAMNSRVDPGWREAGNAWYRAVWTECAELLEHYGWKWWRDQARDMRQVKLEIVDIWHFVMSDLLVRADATDAAVAALAERVEQAFNSPAPCADLPAAIEAQAAAALNTRRADAAVFATLARCAALSFDELYTLYIGKNTLNMFRQDHGYKQGQYIKVWDGKEDNQHLDDILRQLEPDMAGFADAVYRGLQAVYPG